VGRRSTEKEELDWDRTNLCWDQDLRGAPTSTLCRHINKVVKYDSGAPFPERGAGGCRGRAREVIESRPAHGARRGPTGVGSWYGSRGGTP